MWLQSKTCLSHSQKYLYQCRYFIKNNWVAVLNMTKTNRAHWKHISTKFLLSYRVVVPPAKSMIIVLFIVAQLNPRPRRMRLTATQTYSYLWGRLGQISSLNQKEYRCFFYETGRHWVTWWWVITAFHRHKLRKKECRCVAGFLERRRLVSSIFVWRTATYSCITN